VYKINAFRKGAIGTMQTQQSRETAKSAYFKRRADEARRELHDVETRLNAARRQRQQMAPKVSGELEHRINYLADKQKQLRRRVGQAMFNVGGNL